MEKTKNSEKERAEFCMAAQSILNGCWGIFNDSYSNQIITPGSFKAMSAKAVLLEAIAVAMAALVSHGCHAMGFDNFHIKKLVISGHGGPTFSENG